MCVASDFTVMYRNEPYTELYARVSQLVEQQTCKQEGLRSVPALGK